jgi:RNA polymerase sigma factor (TIGR02999 family)
MTLASDATLVADVGDDATVLLAAVDAGDTEAKGKLLELVYTELRHLAASKMAREAPGQTLQATALVHEAWLRLVGAKNLKFENRAQFFSAAAEAMRRILIERARRKRAQRHGGGHARVDVGTLELAAPDRDQRLLDVHEVLDKLTAEHPLHAKVVMLRYFVGMTNEEASEILGLSVATVKNYWTFARSWIFNEIKSS